MKRIFLGLILAAVPGAATTIVGHVGGDAAFNLYMQSLGVPGFENLPAVDYTYEVFSAQGRIGNNMANGTNEIGLHWNNPADDTPPSSSPAIAGTGSTGSTVTFTFGPLGTPLYQASITDPYVADVTLLAFRSRAAANPAMPKNQASLTNLVLNGTILIPASAALSDEAFGGGTVVENVVVKDLLGDFVLTGQTVLNWDGNRPGNSNLAWQIKAFRGVPERTTDEVPEPSTLLLAGAGLILIRLRK